VACGSGTAARGSVIASLLGTKSNGSSGTQAKSGVSIQRGSSVRRNEMAIAHG
jgi:hypothetical protein